MTRKAWIAAAAAAAEPAAAADLRRPTASGCSASAYRPRRVVALCESESSRRADGWTRISRAAGGGVRRRAGGAQRVARRPSRLGRQPNDRELRESPAWADAQERIAEAEADDLNERAARAAGRRGLHRRRRGSAAAVLAARAAAAGAEHRADGGVLGRAGAASWAARAGARCDGGRSRRSSSAADFSMVRARDDGGVGVWLIVTDEPCERRRCSLRSTPCPSRRCRSRGRSVGGVRRRVVRARLRGHHAEARRPLTERSHRPARSASYLNEHRLCSHGCSSMTSAKPFSDAAVVARARRPC